MSKGLIIELFCGLGGWSKGFLAEGFDCIGFDIERHQYGEKRYPAQLVLQDVLTLHGSQFRHCAGIVASPPCQRYSYMAMPWSRAKTQAAEIRADASGRLRAELNALFLACFRIQREASESAGRPIPMIVENVKGAQPWVGMAQAHFGSFYLWGDVESVGGAVVLGGSVPRFGGLLRMPGRRKTRGHVNQRDGAGHTRHLTNQAESNRARGTKQNGSGAAWFDTGIAALPSSSPRRRQATAEVAEIPPDLARWVARSWANTLVHSGGFE